jgi:hypothetical protein
MMGFLSFGEVNSQDQSDRTVATWTVRDREVRRSQIFDDGKLTRVFDEKLRIAARCGDGGEGSDAAPSLRETRPDGPSTARTAR